ncbi:tannase/feruloyl esterase family alpha/beta hydrolase [Aurantiacibacter gilvus]|uniref:Tannase/feruloyl esterase family alpha/beta hydrolase n=1 Tax=Aurantiacibacter gilvus TaxID=3139141 RepID=A0ABU9IFF5_9SPHN
MALISALPNVANAQDHTLDTPSCEALSTIVVSAEEIGLPTGGAAVGRAQMLAADDGGAENDPDGEVQLPRPHRCLVTGEIAPVDPEAPMINFAVNLPVVWNGRALQSGGGGLGGVLISAPGNKGQGRMDPIPLDEPYPITLGYAVFGSDGGHQSGDLQFAYNDEAMRNWAGDALKKTRDVALTIIGGAYGRQPDRLYFTGESAGARETLWVAQRYPQDYDGFIATSPVLNWNYIHIADGIIRDRLIEGPLSVADIALVAENTRTACDALDGLEDGVIARYLECPNTVADLRCEDGATGEGCLSDAQIQSVNAIRQPWSMNVPMANNVIRNAGYGTTGDEDGDRYQWNFYTVGAQPPAERLPAGSGFEPGVGAILGFANFWVRHAIAQDPEFEPRHFNPELYEERIQYLSQLFDATDPDLSGLANSGARLIVYQPSADNAVGTPMVSEWYRSVVNAIGEEMAGDVLRYYVGPGGGHNATGITQMNTLALLESWVEDGVAPPDALVAVDIDPVNLTRGREMLTCRYPAYAHYIGDGHTETAASFECRDRPDPMEFHPN